ncbi:flagellar biosynthesis protein FlhA [Gluconobacter frateurii NBRC 101659]|nr:flagellar biosynthesis protein FlhA [Gluconobacter frateurii NBRC 101659]
MKNFQNAFRLVSQRQDLALVAVLVLTVAMLIMPMPAALADILIGCNLAFSALLLMVAVYLRSPLDLTALPGMILVSTVFRLALEVTVTRLILTSGDAGTIVATFGEFVIGGNIVVGLVVFAIVTTVQFIVVTKGTERVAEVGARFTLDAMPGKQMSIDSDLRSGDIDQAEARKRRQELASESALHGAMDGALKFVKGDAIAGLVIIGVNLAGGIGIGVAQRGLSLSDAMHTYTLLTVGDALISQIPALLLSIAAAVVVTRVGSHGQDLGKEMVGQLTADRRALLVAAIMLLIMAMIPGFPKSVFLGLSILFLLGSRPDWKKLWGRFSRTSLESAEAEEFARSVTTESTAATAIADSFSPLLAISLSPAVMRVMDRPRLDRLLAIACEDVESDLGVVCPKPAIRSTAETDAFHFSIDLEDVPVEEHDALPNHLLLHDDPVHLDLAGIASQSGEPLTDSGASLWIARTDETRLKAAGIGYLDLPAIIANRFRTIARKHVGRFIGLQEARRLVLRLEPGYGDLVREAMRIVPTQRLADILRRLVEEGVPLKNMRLILETLVEWGEKETRSLMLVEYVRQALSRQICHRHAGSHKAMAGLVLGQDVEQAVRQAVRDTSGGSFLALDPDVSQRLLSAFRTRLSVEGRPKNAAQMTPIVITSVDIRRFVRGFLVRNDLDHPVLSYQDLATEFPVHPIGSISLGLAGEISTAAQA